MIALGVLPALCIYQLSNPLPRSTRPFLSSIEKKWIAFQLLIALRDARNRKVSHGDIKSENILVTSWNWVYVSDFASYKPTYLPLDDPSDFSFYFDTSGSRTCYIAPERFYTASDNPEISAKKSKLAMEDGEGSKRDGKVTEAMDCFSAGCVIAELFLEGAPLYKLSQLFQYREGEFSVDHSLSAIEDGGVRVSFCPRPRDSTCSSGPELDHTDDRTGTLS
jgi:phosphoinositide-3-kinase regulatory subunit 4